MHRTLSLLLLVVVLTAPARAQEPGQADKAQFPCAFADYRVDSATDVLVNCRLPLPSGTMYDIAGDIVEADDDGQWIESTRRDVRFVATPDDRRWIHATLSAGQRALETGKSYVLRTRTQYPVNGVQTAFERETLGVSTKPVTSITMAERTTSRACGTGDGRLYFMRSKIQIDDTTLSAGMLTEDPGRLLNATFSPWRRTDSDANQIGRACVFIGDPGPSRLNSHLTLTGVKDVLGGTLLIPAAQRLKLPSAPADKDSAAYYVRFLHESASGSKPGYALDAKAAPRIKNLGKGAFLAPSVTADLGLRTVTDVKVTDMIKAGVGVTKVLASGTSFIEVTPAGSFETDRHWHHRNVLFDGDAHVFPDGWQRSIALQNQQKYAEAALTAINAGGEPPAPDSVESAKWGWQLQIFVGAEVGRALSADDAKSSDEATTVVIPSYDIARVRPRVSATVEYRRLSVSGSIVPRYLFATETVTRERAATSADDPAKNVQQIYLDGVDGWQAFLEVGISWMLDREGHFLLGTTYKNGEQPPNFQSVNTIQTGVTLKF